MQEIYDVVVIGSGASGMTASIYASRSGLSVALIEKGLYGGVLNKTETVENYTGMTTVRGEELAEKMEEHVRSQENIEHIYGDVLELHKNDDIFEISLKKQTILGKSVVIATGVKHKKMNIEGENVYEGTGISNCAMCDGMFFKGKEVVVVGGGDSAVESAEYLSNIVEKVTLIHRRDELRADKISQDRLFSKDNVEFIWNADVKMFGGNDKELSHIVYVENDTGKVLAVDGAFVNIGIVPNTEVFSKLGILDSEGFIITNSKMETKIDGLFAVGDVRRDSIRQVVSATGDGAIASQSVLEYLKERGDSIG